MGIVLLISVFFVPPQAQAQTPRKTHRAAGFDIEVIGDLKNFTLTSDTQKLMDGVEVLTLTLRSPKPAVPPTFSLKWSIPSHGVAGHWMTGRGQTKTIRSDWSGNRLQASMLAREAPVSTLYCQGRAVKRGTLHLNRTPQEIDVPVSGLIELVRE